MQRTRPTSCPWCYAFIDGATDVHEDENLMPTPGDVSICWYCARLGTYTDDLSIRKPTDEEREAFLADEEVVLAIHHVKTHGPRDPGSRP